MDDVSSIISNARFSPVRLRQGYDMDSVDAFLDTLAAAAAEGADLAPLVDAARFATTSLREAYDIAEVDDFLRSVVTGRVGEASGPGTADAAPAPGTNPSTAPVPRAADDGVIHEVPGLFARLFGRR